MGVPTVQFQIVESWDWAGAGDLDDNQHKMSRATWYCGDPHVEGDGTTTRRAVFERLCLLARLAATGYPALVGLSFPFSFPFREKKNRFPDGSTTWLDFSNRVYDVLGRGEGRAIAYYGRPEMYGRGAFADHFAHLNQGMTNVGPSFMEAYRATERNVIQLGITVYSVFRLTPPMVGVQALAGIFLLQSVLRFCFTKKYPLTIWPLGYLSREGHWLAGDANWADPGLVLVETNPRLSYFHAKTQFLRFNTREEYATAADELGSHLDPEAVTTATFRPDRHPSHDAVVTLFHLLSPGWFRAQVRPDLGDNDGHVRGASLPRPSLLWFEVPATPVSVPVTAELRATEGNVFGA